MRYFGITFNNGNYERLGVLSGFTKSPTIKIETPTTALFTKGGSVVHLTTDVLTRVFSTPQLLWLPLSNCIQLETGARGQSKGVANFAGLPEHIACVSMHDSNEETPIGHFEKDMIPLWTRNGKQMINANRYMDVMEAFRPEIMLTVADSSISFTEGFKRVSKSVDRTCSMLEVCIKRYQNSPQLQNTALVGVVVGGSRKEERQKCLNRILVHKDVLRGVALSGLTSGGPDTHKITVDLVEPIFKETCNTFPSELFRVLEGCWNPVVTLAAVAYGFDIFDGSYPAKLTNIGHALVLNFSLVTESSTEDLCILNLNDARYKEDFRPLLSSCKCLTCTKHTRAYIHHLLTTKEMLALVLLNIHNLHHYNQMFEQIRQHIQNKTFQEFRDYITNQYECYMRNEKESDVDDLYVHQSKKKRLKSTPSSTSN